jgi:protein-L-isoaspartate(D-aspartate) O-methyltransferase
MGNIPANVTGAALFSKQQPYCYIIFAIFVVKVKSLMKKKSEKDFLIEGMRNKLVATLRKKGISNEAVLAAIGEIPRHLFIDSGLETHAYEDKAVSIGVGQTISQPYTVAFQSQLLDIQKWDKVLEVGTGSGYQTAVLLKLGAKVYTVERQRKLFIHSQQLLHKLGFYPSFFFGDGYEGKPVFAPFQKIIVTAGAPNIPEPLLSQLAVGGRMVIPVGEGNVQKMIVADRISEKEYRQESYGSFAFVPLLKGTNG